jgi:hypothetical protein
MDIERWKMENSGPRMLFRRPKHTCPDPELDALLVSPAMMVDPYPIYRRLREEQPVFWSDAWNAWVVSRFADVAESLKDKENLSNENRQALLFSGLTDDERQSLCPLRHYFAQKDVIGSDPPDHTRMRALVQKAFSPKTVNALEPKIRAMAEAMIGGAVKSGRFDFVHEVAHPLPVMLIAEMLGAPVEDRHLFKKWSSDILAFQGTGQTTFGPAMTSQKSLVEMFAYMNALIDDRRKTPREDLITALALAEEGRAGVQPRRAPRHLQHDPHCRPRDDDQPDGQPPPPTPPQPRPVGGVAGQSRADCSRHRGGVALRGAQATEFPAHQKGPHLRRRGVRRERDGLPGHRRSQPRSRQRRGSRNLQHPSSEDRPSLLRLRHSFLLRCESWRGWKRGSCWKPCSSTCPTRSSCPARWSGRSVCSSAARVGC